MSEQNIVFVVVVVIMIAVVCFGFTQYNQCQADGYSKTQCYALMQSNNRMSIVGLDK